MTESTQLLQHLNMNIKGIKMACSYSESFVFLRTFSAAKLVNNHQKKSTPHAPNTQNSPYKYYK